MFWVPAVFSVVGDTSKPLLTITLVPLEYLTMISSPEVLRLSPTLYSLAAGMALMEMEERTGSLTLTCMVGLRTLVELPLLVLVTSQ